MAKPTSRLGVEQFAGRGGPQDLPSSMLQYGVGLQLFDPSVYANGGGHTFADGIVASPGGGQLNATKLKAAINHITVCATAGDSLALPPAVGGQMMVVINDGIADAQVFAALGTSDTINGVAGATGMALAPSTSVILSAPGHHVWHSTPSGDAVGSSPGVTSWNTRVGAVTLTVGDVTAVLPASATNPAMDGTAAPGVSPTWSAGDHVHPTDSTRYAASNPAGYVTAGGAATAAPVQSVATRTGAVTLTHADITDWAATLAPYATLAYVQGQGYQTAAQVTATVGNYLPLAGGILTGSLQVMNVLTVKENPAGNNSVIQLQNTAGSPGRLWVNTTTNTFIMDNQIAGGGSLQLNPDNSFQIASGTALKPSGGSWTATSDARVKTVAGDYLAGLDAIIQLHPVYYAYKGNDAPPGETSPHALTTGQTFVGLVAQEAETVLPGMVSQVAGWIDGAAVTDLRTMDTSELVFALVNAVRELSERLVALERQTPPTREA